MSKILTVISPSYNMEKYLKRCLSSLIVDQRMMSHFEALVINDGSKDRTSLIGHSFEDRFPDTFRVIDKKNGHYGSCVNYGLKEARGTFVKILDADFSFDGTRLQVSYASDNDEKVDLKSLKFDIMRNFSGVNAVDLRQLGPRDVAKAIPGMGACGLSCRCCCRYLTEFSSISIKMAKEQGISLTPAEITGMCGRLRCCLVFENEYYVECRKRLPKKNKRVMTPQGEGKVLEVFPLRDAVLVDIPEVGRREFKREQINVETAVSEAKAQEESEQEPEENIASSDLLALVSGSDKYAETERKERVPRQQGKPDRKPRPERKERQEREKTDRPEKPERRERSGKPSRQPRSSSGENARQEAAAED